MSDSQVNTPLTEVITPDTISKFVSEPTQKFIYQMVLRAILLKINSKKAHELMLEQVKSQWKIVQSYVLEIMTNELFGEFGIHTVENDKEIQKVLKTVSERLDKEGNTLIDTIFSEPSGVANTE